MPTTPSKPPTHAHAHAHRCPACQPAMPRNAGTKVKVMCCSAVGQVATYVYVNTSCAEMRQSSLSASAATVDHQVVLFANLKGKQTDGDKRESVSLSALAIGLVEPLNAGFSSHLCACVCVCLVCVYVCRRCVCVFDMSMTGRNI